MTGNRVNVRTGPGVDRSVRLQVVAPSRRVVEIGRARQLGERPDRGLRRRRGLDSRLRPPCDAGASGEGPAASQPGAGRDAVGRGRPRARLLPVPRRRASRQPGSAGGRTDRSGGEVGDRSGRPATVSRQRRLSEQPRAAVAGVDLFTEVEPLGGGAVQVGATDAWSSIPPAGQQSYANTLLDRWAAAIGRAKAVTVRIVSERPGADGAEQAVGACADQLARDRPASAGRSRPQPASSPTSIQPSHSSTERPPTLSVRPRRRL